MKRWGLLLAIGAMVQGCTASTKYAELPHMGPSMQVVPLGAPVAPSPSPAMVASGASSVSPVALPSPGVKLKALPDRVGLAAGVLPYVDPELTGKAYEALAFTCDYPATWAPFPPSAEELGRGQVLYLESEYNYAWFEVYAFKATEPLEAYYAVYSDKLEHQVDAAVVDLDGLNGFQIQVESYYNGKELKRYVLGFVREGSFFSMLIEFDPGSKDVELLQKEIGHILGTWKWKLG